MPSTATTLHGRLIDEVGNLLLQPPLGGLGRVHNHGPRSRRRVALTFDDGPNDPSTNNVLDMLAAHGVKATFFCVGVNASRFPQIVKRTYMEGHIIGNHSMYHSRKSALLWSDNGHIDDCTRVLTDILGVMPRLYRAPWGWLTPWETQRLIARRFAIIGWDVYTYDWQVSPPSGEEIAAGVQRDAKPGSVVLFHDGIAGVHSAEKPQTVRAVERTITSLRATGFEFVTIPELLNIDAYAQAPPAGDAALKVEGGR